jgi:hypothetical protein
MKPPSQVGNGENYPSFGSPDRGAASLILVVGKRSPGRTQTSGLIHSAPVVGDDGVLAFTGFGA